MDNRKEKKVFCPYCGFEHTAEISAVPEESIFNGVSVEYMAEYYYCEKEKGFFESGKQEFYNWVSAKNAYHEKMWELTGGISKSKLAIGKKSDKIC